MDKRRLFIQCFMSKGILNAKQVKELLRNCDVQLDSTAEIANYVHNMNAALAHFHMEIKKGIQEEDGANFYCLVNTVESNISRMLSTYSPNELELFKKLIEQICESEGEVGSLVALSLTEKLDKRMGKEEAQNFLDRLENDKWIKKGSDGKISLSVRCIVELDQYLRDMYTSVLKMCSVCSKICLIGETCGSCGIKLHKKCAETLLKHCHEKRCPNKDCKAIWDAAFSK